ncbi:4-hydroxy-3-methylbut-2-enyl diphosphate reductase [Elusimicrobium posterum]|uniref:4-hydroxy-3-methylbut-2-enyl diphosphate reductase n=1 Tax=Elusimicrobium posterum TaxID=3116653 RepID=UPI003C72CA0D
MEKEKDFGVIVAKSAGFCPGVKKAIDKVLELEAGGKKNIFTIGPLIHNKSVIETLEAKGIKSIDHPSDAKTKEAVLVIRAHGITPEFQQKIQDTGYEVVDATCPLVKHVHNIIQKYAQQGYDTVIVGDAGHAEVVGLLGYTQGRGHVVANEEEAAALPQFEKLNIVAQTTQKESSFLKIAEIIKTKAKEVIVSNTICEPTKQRQTETVDMAKNADLVIVVGGKNSANTARLAMLCSSLAPKVLHVENETELKGEDLISPKKIFITAGASTPNWMIDRIANMVKDARRGPELKLGTIIKDLWNVLVKSSLYTAFAALALTYVCMKLQGIRFDPYILAMSWLFIFSLTIINRGVSKSALGEKKLPIAIGVFAGFGALAISYTYGWKIFIITFVFCLIGVAYPFRHMISIKKFSAFPATKDISTALGWAFVCAYLPASVLGLAFTKANYLAIFYALLLVFIRSVILNLGAAQKDIMIGKESFYKAFGLNITRFVISILIIALTVVLILLLTMGWKVKLVSMLLLGNVYIICIAVYYYLKQKPRTIMEETLVDGQFFVLSILAFLSRFI